MSNADNVASADIDAILAGMADPEAAGFASDATDALAAEVRRLRRLVADEAQPRAIAQTLAAEVLTLRARCEALKNGADGTDWREEAMRQKAAAIRLEVLYDDAALRLGKVLEADFALRDELAATKHDLAATKQARDFMGLELERYHPPVWRVRCGDEVTGDEAAARIALAERVAIAAGAELSKLRARLAATVIAPVDLGDESPSAPLTLDGMRIKVDFPGQVYGDKARISFLDAEGGLVKCRAATEQERLMLATGWARRVSDYFRMYDGSLEVDLWYPRDAERPKDVILGLVDTRAAQDLRISYEFGRGGWLIEIVSAEDDDGSRTWAEAAFVPEPRGPCLEGAT